MPSLYHMLTCVLVLVLAVASVFAIPVDRRENSLFRQRRSLQGIAAQGDSGVSDPLMRMLFKEKGPLLDFLSSRSREEKRQRQCYWSVISCY